MVVALNVEHGNVSGEEAIRLALAAGMVDDVPHEPGSTEPWISQLVASFIVARGARTVLETGCFKGATTVWMQDALGRLDEPGYLHVCEIIPERMDQTIERFAKRRLANPTRVQLCPHNGDVLQYLSIAKDCFDLALVDDNHEKKHVEQELTLLYPKMNPGGLILLHDVVGSCDLRTVVAKFGGYSLDLPRLGPAGGLGLIQVP